MYFIFTNEIKYRREAPLKPRKKGAKRPKFLVKVNEDETVKTT